MVLLWALLPLGIAGAQDSEPIRPLTDAQRTGLLTELADPANLDARRQAMARLLEDDGGLSAAASQLLDLALDADPVIARGAHLLLARFEPEDQAAIPTLKQSLQDPNAMRRALARQTLRRIAPTAAAPSANGDPLQIMQQQRRQLRVRLGDWPMLGGSPHRNNTAAGSVPDHWKAGDIERRTRRWLNDEAQNVRWVAKIGTQSFGSPVIANGKVYVAGNNGAAHLARFPANVDLGCMFCFSEKDGQLLWQYSSHKLLAGRVHDWPLQGICSAPVIENDRLWFVNNRGEVCCLDTEGFRDQQDDGPVRGVWQRKFNIPADVEITNGLAVGEVSAALRKRFAQMLIRLPERLKIEHVDADHSMRFLCDVDGRESQFRLAFEGNQLLVSQEIPLADDEADIVWKFDMMQELGVLQHNMAACSPVIWGDLLFINTSNGVNLGHQQTPAIHAPSFIALNKNTGKLVWSDNSPGRNILHGQWSSPTVGVFAGVPQVIFAGGDGWLYAFHAEDFDPGRPQLLWKFDCNPKNSKWILGGRGTRNNIIGHPVVYDGRVYVAVGQDPEHGEGVGHLWCIDPTRRGDVSSELVVDENDDPAPPRRLQAVVNMPWEQLLSVDLPLPATTEDGKLPPYLKAAMKSIGYALPDRYTFQKVGDGKWFLSARIGDRGELFKMEATQRKTRQGVVMHATRISRKAGRERVIPNPNSALVWRYDGYDINGDGELEFEEEMHRTLGSPAIRDDMLVISDYSGLLHCVNAKTGVPYWVCDLLASCWCSPLIVDGRVYIGDEDGDVAIMNTTGDPRRDGLEPDGVYYMPKREVLMPTSVMGTPAVANGVLYVVTRTHLFAISE